MVTVVGRKTDIFVPDDSLDWHDLGGGTRRKIMVYNDQIMMVRVAFEAGAVGAQHRHPHVQATYVARGSFDVTIDGKTRRLGQGDTFLAPPDAMHGVVCIEPGELVDVFNPAREDFLA